jgi:putative drug exporter of the RND superfamily
VGLGASLIGVHTTLPIPAYVPMLVFAIVFGLSMDYEVFLLSRVHEAWIETGDPHRAVAVGIGATARVITTAAAIMVVVFASFVLSTDPTVKMLAIGMAFAVLIDASLVRMILVPSIMALLDARAWWMPRWMEPIVPQLQLEGSVVEPGPVPAPSEPESAPVAPVSVSADGSASAPASSDRSAAASAPSDGSKPAPAPSDGPAPASAPGREAAAARREPTEQ